MTTTAGDQKATVTETAFTTYQNQEKRPASAGAVAKGEPVLVFGWTSGSAITVTQVMQPTGHLQVPRRHKSVSAREIPAGFSQGSGSSAPSNRRPWREEARRCANATHTAIRRSSSGDVRRRQTQLLLLAGMIQFG
jgi:hypothetical protein